MFRTNYFKISLLLFITLQIIIYLTIYFFHGTVPFDKVNYLYYSHHYVQDARAYDGAFSFLRSLGVWDAQWYLRIADAGYPPKVVFDAYSDPRYMGALTYAFFPLYPVILAFVNAVIHNIELTAFLVSNLLLIANFVSLYYIITKLFEKEIAVRTIFLLFLFPFSIFYRSYYTENIFLLLLLWFGYFLIKHKWFLTTVTAALLFITRPNGLFLLPIYLYSVLKGVLRKKITWYRAVLYVLLSFIPIALWCLYCYYLTGNPFYWHKVQSVWYTTPSVAHTFISNLQHVLGFFGYALHGTRESKLDIIILFLTVGLLIWSKRFFKKYPQLWWISFMLCISPLLVKDLMSYSRYQIISYPLFIFLAAKLTGWKFYAVSGIFFALLLFTSIYFVNWQWVG